LSEDIPTDEANLMLQDYLEDENDEEEGSSVEPSTTSTTSASPPTTPSTITTTSTTTTTTTTTTPRFVKTNRYEHKEVASTGSQYNGYQEKNEYPPMSSHSALKWQQLGTREAVKETRNSLMHYGKLSRSAEAFAARSHIQRVQTEGSCQWPRIKVIPVREIYPNSTLVYNPHCAMLHRCSDDTGCCRSEAYTCEAKRVERVELYFYTTSINGKMEIEKLSFDNHTECECRERKDSSGNSESRVARHYNPSVPAPQNISRPPTKRPCRCPARFNARITTDGLCECSCLEKDMNCTKLQRGRGFLSLMDRECIQQAQCKAPNCEFGTYNVTAGKCPYKSEIFSSTPNYRSHYNYYQRRS
ncbi:vascular endothelial growth factor A, long form-like, partial [Phymastichus coffea]|uniref:vascular endothelial growth factor A, long form-like n=1 Tax=Phymastichus coffea TaxID=108790 RepID=UPI00273CD147